MPATVLAVRTGTLAAPLGGLTRPLPPSVVAGASGNDVTLPAAQNGGAVALWLYADGAYLAASSAGVTVNHAAGTGATAYTVVERTATTRSIASPAAVRAASSIPANAWVDENGDAILDENGDYILI